MQQKVVVYSEAMERVRLPRGRERGHLDSTGSGVLELLSGAAPQRCSEQRQRVGKGEKSVNLEPSGLEAPPTSGCAHRRSSTLTDTPACRARVDHSVQPARAGGFNSALASGLLANCPFSVSHASLVPASLIAITPSMATSVSGPP